MVRTGKAKQTKRFSFLTTQLTRWRSAVRARTGLPYFSITSRLATAFRCCFATWFASHVFLHIKERLALVPPARGRFRDPLLSEQVVRLKGARVERPQHGESTCLMSRCSVGVSSELTMSLVQIKTVQRKAILPKFVPSNRNHPNAHGKTLNHFDVVSGCDALFTVERLP